MRSNLVLAALLLALPVVATPAEYNPARRHPHAAAEEMGVHRIIVKFRAPTDTTRLTIQSVTNRVASLAGRSSVIVKRSREIGGALHVMHVESAVPGESMARILERLRADPDVEYAEPDQRRYPHAVPNDPRFASQWYLQKAQASAIDSVDAWETTTGSASVVVAIVDTGVRFEHPDLARESQGGRLLSGFDFVSENSPGVFATANDGDGWDADASDPGDWIDPNDLQSSRFSGCEVGSSSWHGTRVAGIIGARTNNAAGIAGGTWGPLLLPVRVLGKCGGFDSDVIAAIRWAAGISISGVPVNLHPARIINLSLGATGACPNSYRSMLDELRALGVLVVASAGNENGHAVDSPANCPGVLGVSALRHAGTKVGFSNIGPAIGISAPGGNCVNSSGGPCVYSLDTTTDAGTTTPAGPAYTDQFNTNLGTSFSAPIVVSAAALVRSVNTKLTPAQVIVRLRQSATAFPVLSGIPSCQVPTSSSADQMECNCTTTTCGAGMVNANAAVIAALRPFVIVSATPLSPSSGQTVTLTGSESFVTDNRTIASYAWTVVSTGGVSPVLTGANTATASFTAPVAGAITLRLTVTDSEGVQGSADVVVTTPTPAPPPASPPPSPHSSGGGGGAPDFFWFPAGALALASRRRDRRYMRRCALN